MKGDAFGTTYTIQYFGKEQQDISTGIDSVLNSVNESVSTYLPNSLISKLNRGETGLQVDAIFKENFEISKTVHAQSEGYFDPTVGILRNAYGFGDTAPIKHLDSLVLDSLREFVGFQKVQLFETGSIQKQAPQIYLDFNAVAKGYGIDQVSEYLISKGIQHYLIELGGEILAKGRNQETQKRWTVGVEGIDSDLENRTFTHVIAIQNLAVASSGNYRKFRIDSLTGQKFVHTINPLNGKAEASNVTSATVTASTCALADAYATACMAMGLERAKQMLERLDGVEAYLTYIDEKQQSKSYATKGFKELIVE